MRYGTIYLEEHRTMIHYLTVISRDDFDDMAATLLEFGPSKIFGLVTSLGITLEGCLKYIAYMEGHTYEEQLQILALQTENFTQEEVETIVKERERRKRDDG